MSQRVPQDAPAPEAEEHQVVPAQPAPGSSPGPSSIKHCWIDDEHGRLPGLLLQWRRTAAGFQGRVVRPVLDPAWGWVIVEEWLPATMLGPATGPATGPAGVRDAQVGTKVPGGIAPPGRP